MGHKCTVQGPEERQAAEESRQKGRRQSDNEEQRLE